MPQCFCPDCSDSTLETYSQAYREACEVRSLAGLRSNAERTKMLGLIAKKRGAAEAERLRQMTFRFMQTGSIS